MYCLIRILYFLFIFLQQNFIIKYCYFFICVSFICIFIWIGSWSLQLAVQAAAESGQTAAPVSDGTTPSQPATTAPGQTTAEAPKPEGSTDQAPLNSATTAERSERTLVTPWLRFLWESYRQCLDLLRNNAKLERLYQDVAQLGMQFSFFLSIDMYS